MTTDYQLIEQSSLSETYGYFYKDPYIICPYEPAHIIMKSRIQGHLVKCMKNHPHITKIACPFNATHRLDVAEMAFHMSECPNRGVMLNFKYTVGKSSFPGPKLVPVQNLEIESEENWDDSNTPAYDPSMRLKDGKLLVQPKGATPSERARFREERHALYEKEVKSSSEDSGIDPCAPPNHGSSKTKSSTMTQASGTNKNSTSGLESLTPDAQTFYHRNKPLVDGSTTVSASFSANFSWMPKSTTKTESSLNSVASTCNPTRPSLQNKYSLPTYDMNISTDVGQKTQASVKSSRTAAMSFCSESASQASFTPRTAGRGDFRRANSDIKPGFNVTQFESTRNKNMKGRAATFLASNNNLQCFDFHDFEEVLSTSLKSGSTYEPSDTEYCQEGVGRPSNLATRRSYVQPPPQPWAVEKSTGFWEPESSRSSSPCRVKSTSGGVDYSLSGIGRGRRFDSLA